MSELKNKVECLGFPPLEEVAGLHSVSHLFGTSKPRCGIYLLAFDDGSIYIGQATDAVRRFGQHRKTYRDIAGYSFLPVPESQLDGTEVRLIHAAQNEKLVLHNVIYVADIMGDTDLDLIIPADEQPRWLTHPKETNANDQAERIRLPELNLVRQAKRFSRFMDGPHHEGVLAVLRLYVNNCLPLPRRSEYSFWSLSCIPSTNANSWPRLAVVNLAVMETLVLFHLKNHPEKPMSFMVVASDVLAQQIGGMKKFRSRFPGVFIEKSQYRDAGPYQCRIHAFMDEMQDLLEDPVICRAAGHLALRVMRKRATIYSRHHCQQLADLVIN